MPRPQLFVLVASADSASLLELAADGIDDAAAVVARRVVEVPVSSATSSAWLGESDTGLTFVTTTESFDTDGHWLQWQGPCQLDDDAARPADPKHVRQAIELSVLAGPTQTETVVVECPAASVPMLLDACIAADITVTVIQEGRDPTEVKFQPSHRPRLESTDDGDSGGGGGGAGKNVFWGDNVVRLSDRAPLAARAKQLVDALTGKLRFSLWLMPAAGSKFERGATLTIQTVCCFSRPRTVNMLSESGRYNAGVATSPTAQLDPRLSPWCRILQPTDIESFPAAAPAAHRAPCSWQPLLRFRRSRRTSRLGRRSSHHSATRWQSAMPHPTGSRGTLSAAPPVTSVGPWTTRSGPWQSR